MRAAPLLAPLQSRMQSFLLQGGADLRALVVADDIADAQTRLGIYADAYRLRLLEVLRGDYPVLFELLGAESFEGVGRGYIAAHPSDTPSLRWFGRHLAEHLRAVQPQRPELADLAAFEWSQGEVFDAPDASVLPLAAMTQIAPAAWGEMRVLLHPSARHLQLRSNAAALVGAHGKSQPLPQTQSTPAETWLLWRQQHMIHWRALGVAEAAALDAVRTHLGFGDLCERLCEWIEPEEVAMVAAGMLKRWISDQLVAELEFS
ncbi:MAG: hypothetical protein JWR16_648 [Nevskia sp.]|nr:hypothetical protein [Nevskia sp.]